MNKNVILVGDIGKRRGERREERRNMVGLKHILILGKSINVSYRKGQKVTTLGDY